MARAEAIAERRYKIRRLLTAKNSLQTIKEVFEKQGTPITLRTLYRDLEEIKHEDRKWFYQLAKEETIHAYRSTIESIQERQRQLAIIASQDTTDPRDRIEANKAIAELDIAVLNIYAYAPDVLGNAQEPKSDDRSKS